MNNTISSEHAFDHLEGMAQVIGETPRVLEKAKALYRTPVDQRNLVLQGIIKHMIDSAEDEDIVQTFKLLVVPAVYMGVMEALHDCGYMDR